VYVNQEKEVYGTDIAVHNTSCKPSEKMYGVRWHQSIEEGKTLAYYTPNSCTLEIIKKYALYFSPE
jgi:hypothetical protein